MSNRFPYYVKKIDNKYVRSHIAQIRAGILPLQIEIGRHRGIEVSDRKCILCDLNEVEDEFHFIWHCTLYIVFRDELFNSVNINNFNLLCEKDKFISILDMSSKSVGRFIVNCFEKRKSMLYKS